MKKTFSCSLVCHNGIVGGALSIDNISITYKTNKLTVDRRYRELVLSLNDICDISWKWIVFPIAILHMKNGEQYTFMIFNKKGFNKYYNEVKSH